MSAATAPAWRIIAEREVTTRIRDKAFLGGIAFTLVFLIGFLIVSAVLGGDAGRYTVAVTDSAGERVVRLAESNLRAGNLPDAEITVEQAADVEAAEQLVADGEADAALLQARNGFEIVGDEEVDGRLRAALSGAVSAHVIADNAAAQGVDLDALSAGTATSERLLSPNAEQSEARSIVAFAFALVFFMTAFGFGMTISQSVVQEKESRVVEILAAAVPIRAMLWGKIAGNTLLALGQVVLIAGVAVIGLVVTDRGDLLSGIGPAVIWYVAFFVLGFVTLASLWSVAGSLASRQEDLQSTTMPGQLLLIVPYFVAVLAGEQVRVVFSMLPIVSTMIMPGRMAQEAVPWWQIAVAIGLTVAAAVVFVRVGSRLYERTLLRTRGKVSYREAFATAGD